MILLSALRRGGRGRLYQTILGLVGTAPLFRQDLRLVIEQILQEERALLEAGREFLASSSQVAPNHSTAPGADPAPQQDCPPLAIVRGRGVRELATREGATCARGGGGGRSWGERRECGGEMGGEAPCLETVSFHKACRTVSSIHKI